VSRAARRPGARTAAAVLLLAALAPAAPGSTLLAEADALYARRAEGARGGTGDPRVIDEAIAAYRKARAESPHDLQATAGLLRALNFRATYCGAAEKVQEALLEEGRSVGQAAVDRVEAAVKARDAAARIAAIRDVPFAASAYLWTAIVWGQWALVRGKFAAARQGVAGKIRDLSETVVAVDPQLEDGGGYRVLGRLHDQAPKIVFITGWVSRPRSIEMLRRSDAVGPGNPVTWFFLAEALLDHDETKKAEALALLRRCVDSPPRPEYAVEDAHYAEQARLRLGRLK
jgi:hypothetical protein